MDNRRKTPRAWWIDYDAGMFFVTVCTKDMVHYFGKIEGGEMLLSEIGDILFNELKHPELHHPDIEIPLFVVMPNHFHAIVYCREIAGNICKNPLEQRNPNPALRPNQEIARHVPALSKYMSSMKSAVSRAAHKVNGSFAWQSRYHDHLIRNPKDGNNIAEYIINNPLNWHSDCFFE